MNRLRKFPSRGLTLFLVCAAWGFFSVPAYAGQKKSGNSASFSLGKKYYKQGNFKAAVEEFQNCVAANPKRQDYQEYLLLAERSSELKDQAINTALEQTEEPQPPEQKITEPKSVKPGAPKPELQEEKKSRNEENVPPTEKGAWTVPKGKLYVESYNKYYWHNAQFDSSRDRERWNYDGRYYELRTELKLEYGLTDNLNVLLYIPYKEAHWKDDFASYTRKGLIDWWAGAKYKVWEDPVVTTLQARVKIPGNYNKASTPGLGTHQTDYDLKVLLAKNLKPFFNGYTKLETGFRWRTHVPTDEIPYFWELGYNLTKDIILKGTIDGIKGIKGTGTLQEDYTKWNLSTIWKLGGYAVEVGYGSTFAGKNTSVGKEIILSLSTQI